MTAEEEQEAQKYKKGAQATASRPPKMLRPTKERALEIVRERLKAVRPCGVPLVVQPKRMYKVGNKWWHVPVYPLDWPLTEEEKAEAQAV